MIFAPEGDQASISGLADADQPVSFNLSANFRIVKTQVVHGSSFLV